MRANIEQQKNSWTSIQKFALYFFFVYFFIQAVPLDWKYYWEILTTNWLKLNFYDLFKLTTYSPVFFGLQGYANWLVAALLALVGAFVLHAQSKYQIDHDKLFYWLRVILRYRLAIAVIAFGLIKVFPLQMPYPSLSNLHTNYGDFLPWKIYFHTLGIAQPYEIFLGATEVLAGLLLLYRRTATLGAGIIIGFTGNIFASNLAYDMGQEVYSLYLTVLAVAIFSYDAPRLYRLLILHQKTIANKYKPVFTASVQKLRGGLKLLTLIFVAVLTITTYINYTTYPYKLPKTPALKNTSGYYNVRAFKLNDVDIPYSDTDTNRWQNVVFEKWATLSIKTAQPIIIDADIPDAYQEEDLDRTYESAGVGGRRYFAYQTDTLASKLKLVNKNKHHANESLDLTYEWLSDSTLILKGVNEKQDSVYAELERIDRKYLLLEGRRKPVKL